MIGYINPSTRWSAATTAACILIATALLVFFLLRRSRSAYRFLGGGGPGSAAASPAYSIRTGGSRGEYNEDCMQFPSYRMCMLTDGTPGVCGLSGMCLPDMLQDLALISHDPYSPTAGNRPHCTEPTFRGQCQQWCECNESAGTAGGNCLAECQSWFFPR